MERITKMRTVLIVDDNPVMLRGLEDNFELRGYRVKTARDGEQGLNITINERPNLIILDIVLPKINGYEMCSLIRKRNLDMPIIMLSGKNHESDIVRGLTLGADDYITKPFSIRELLARAEAFMRRTKEREPAVYAFGNCRLDTSSGTLRRDSREVKLSPKEFEMLHLFVRKPCCVLTREEILNTVWGYSHFITLRSIDDFVRSLRNKVEPDPKNPTFIHTIGEVGYKFEPSEQDGSSSYS
jgi:two-component system alkaline phosphatase synthesis response regulator PhoP